MISSNMPSKKVVTGMKLITGNQDGDFVNVALFKVTDSKIIRYENVENANTCDFQVKSFKISH